METSRRLENPLERWKLSTVDHDWESFTRYEEAMLARTSTDASPWYQVRGNDEKRARLESVGTSSRRSTATSAASRACASRPTPRS